MIGGHDISFRTETPAQVAEGAIRLVRAAWQEAVVENAETGELLGLDSLAVSELPHEVLIYKNAAARDAWAAHGAIPENANLMIHIVCGADSMTMVVDEPSEAEMSAIIRAIRDHIYQDIFWMRAGDVNPVRCLANSPGNGD